MMIEYTVESLVLYCFLAIVFLSFVKLAVYGDNKERTFQKIIGGFAVFVVAIRTENPYVICVSLFIGGLIIASEHFMKMLVAILRADSKDIKELVRVESATPEEVEKKREEDQKEVEEVLKPTADQGTGTNRIGNKQSMYVSLQERKNIEEKVARKLSDKFGFMYEPNSKVSYQDRRVIFDGILKAPDEDHSKYHLARTTAVEIKFVPSPRGGAQFAFIESIVTRTIGHIWSNLRNIEILLVLVANDLEKEEAERLYHRLHLRFPRIYFAIYTYEGDSDTVEELIMGYPSKHIN